MKREKLLDLLCRPPTPGRKEAICLVLWSKVVSLRRKGRFPVSRRVLSHSFSSSRSLGARRCRQHYNRRSARTCRGGEQSSYNLHHISSGRSMEDIEEDHILFNCDHEPMVVGRAVPSVSLLTFTLSLPAYPPVPVVSSFTSSLPTRSIRPEGHSTILDPLRDYVSIMSRTHANSRIMYQIAKTYSKAFQ